MMIWVMHVMCVMRVMTVTNSGAAVALRPGATEHAESWKLRTNLITTYKMKIIRGLIVSSTWLQK